MCFTKKKDRPHECLTYEPRQDVKCKPHSSNAGIAKAWRPYQEMLEKLYEKQKDNPK